MASLLRGHCRPEVGSAAEYNSGDVVSSYFSKTSTHEEVQVKEKGNVEVNNLSQSKKEVVSNLRYKTHDVEPQVTWWCSSGKKTEHTWWKDELSDVLHTLLNHSLHAIESSVNISG